MRRFANIHRKVVIGKVVPLGSASHRIMIGNDADNLDRKLADLVLVKQIDEAMSEL